MEITIDSLQDVSDIAQQAAVSVALIDDLLGIEVPASLAKAVEANWIGVAGDIGEALFGEPDEEEMAKWSRRVMRLSDANVIIAACEKTVVEYLLERTASPWYAIAKGMTAVPLWVVTHVSDLWEVVLPLLGTVIENVGNYLVLKHTLDAWILALGTGIFNGSALTENQKLVILIVTLKLQSELNTMEEMVQWCIAVMGVIVAYYQYSGAINMFGFGIVKYKEASRSSLLALTEFEKQAREKAFPQAARVAVRRRKRSR